MNEFTFGYRPERRYKAYIVEVIDHTLEALQLQCPLLRFKGRTRTWFERLAHFGAA